MTAPDTVPTPPPARRLPKIRTILILAVIIPLVVLMIYSWLSLHWDYSNGYRSGLLQKFSQKGWLCKTNEGELLQTVGVNPTIWNFTVRDDEMKLALDTLVGRNVRIHYTEHRGVVTSCFGDTPYFADGVTVIKE
jgi:hypothetical protein